MEFCQGFWGESRSENYLYKLIQINKCLLKSTGVLGSPCLFTDREKELEAFRMAQQGSLQQKKGQAVLYEGGKGCGKSQLLAEINFLAQKEGYR